MIYQDHNIEPIDFGEDLWWNFYLQKPLGMETRRPLVDSFTRLGMQVAGEYVSDPHYQLLFHDEEAGIYFEVSNGDDVSSHLTLGMRADEVLPPDSLLARLNADRFLEYGKVCYQALQPVYAFAENLNTYVERDDVEACQLTHICWAQFFGPDFARGIGRKVLINAPAWRNENLGDGGLLYVLAASPYLYQGPWQYWEAARQYFEQHIPRPIVWSDMPK
jgi:hypothetical protein